MKRIERDPAPRPKTRAEREAASMKERVRQSEERYREFWESLSPRDRELMPDPT